MHFSINSMKISPRESWQTIEFAALLLISTLFGGMMLYSFGFAPLLFSALPTEDTNRFIWSMGILGSQ